MFRRSAHGDIFCILLSTCWIHFSSQSIDFVTRYGECRNFLHSEDLPFLDRQTESRPAHCSIVSCSSVGATGLFHYYDGISIPDPTLSMLIPTLSYIRDCYVRSQCWYNPAQSLNQSSATLHLWEPLKPLHMPRAKSRTVNRRQYVEQAQQCHQVLWRTPTFNGVQSCSRTVKSYV